MPEEIFPGVEVHFRGGHYAVLDAGAHVLAWTPPSQLPVLWVSPLVRFEPGVAVRGGVPVVLPWFGSGPNGDRSPAHGFARTAVWQRTGVVKELATNGRLAVQHSLDSTGFDSAPFAAELLSEFTADHLSVTLTVTNTGAGDFTYEEALHTYLAVSDIRRITIEGLDGCSYHDKVGEEPSGHEQAGPVRFAGETDRLYAHTGTAIVDDPDWGRRIEVSKDGSGTTVVWNPGAAKGSALADVGENWAGFVCVEAANVGDGAIRLAPGESHILTQGLRLA